MFCYLLETIWNSLVSISENQVSNPLYNILVVQTICYYCERSEVSYVDFYAYMYNYSSRRPKAKKIFKMTLSGIIRSKKCNLGVKCTASWVLSWEQRLMSYRDTKSSLKWLKIRKIFLKFLLYLNCNST